MLGLVYSLLSRIWILEYTHTRPVHFLLSKFLFFPLRFTKISTNYQTNEASAVGQATASNTLSRYL